MNEYFFRLITSVVSRNEYSVKLGFKMPKARRHTHKYHRVTLSFAQVWACGAPDCTHYMPEQMAKLVEGKQSICWGCGELMILTPENMKDKQPLCDDCRGVNKISEALSEIEKRFIDSGSI